MIIKHRLHVCTTLPTVQVCQCEDGEQLHDPESELRGPADERQDAHRSLQRILRRTRAGGQWRQG